MKNHYATMNHHNNHHNSSSFSSSLLEQIYRSFDDDDNNNNNHHKTRDTCQSKKPKINTTHKRNTTTSTSEGYFDDVRDERKQFSSRHEIHPYVLQQWIEDHKVEEKEKESKVLKLRRNSMPEDGKFRRNNVYSSSSTSSSDSSSGIGGFSSSDTDSFIGPPTTRLKSKVSMSSLKPIRTAPDFGRKSYSDETPSKKCKKDGKFQHALKLYAELKKAKQPISPGGKLASFINSLFNSGNSKKPKIEPMTSSSLGIKSSSVPSTASSYSRSCLSKTPSSAGRYERRSVRFCPVNVVVDETGQKSVYNDHALKADVDDDVDFKMKILEKQRGVEEAAKKMLKDYQNNNKTRRELKVNVISNNNNNNKFEYNWNNVNMRGVEDEDEDEDDEESCCSSDLFELDNLLEVHELPVYETTHIRTNRAIVKGVIF